MNTAALTALAEPNRVSILELLRDDGALTVGEIAERLALRMPQSSKHLRVLTDAGLVRVQAVANRRIFALRTESFAELDSWLQTFMVAKDEQYNRFERLLDREQGKPPKP